MSSFALTNLAGAGEALAQSNAGRATLQLRAMSTTAGGSAIEKPAREFEAILLTQWLQEAEKGFAKLPGDGEDEDPGADQFRSLALQAVAGTISKGPGLGIAAMIVRYWQTHQERAMPAGPVSDQNNSLNDVK